MFFSSDNAHFEYLIHFTQLTTIFLRLNADDESDSTAATYNEAICKIYANKIHLDL